MKKVSDIAKRWNSCGNEFVECLENNGTKYKILFTVKVFDAVSIEYVGGKEFTIIEYAENNIKRTVALGGFGAGDCVIEEAYLLTLGEGEAFTVELVAKTLREYIQNEEL